LRLNITLVRTILYINEAEIGLDYIKKKVLVVLFLSVVVYVRCVCCHLILFFRLTMEQTDATSAINSLTLDADQMTDFRRSQINISSGTIDEANFFINEVRFYL
jgi:hypothetical protein